MSDPADLLVEHLDIWTSAIERKSGAGRGAKNGSSRKISLYGVEKLRGLILDLAVRGKLVRRDLSDGDAQSYPREITATAKELVKIGEIRRALKCEALDAKKQWFDAPNHWIWVSLGTATNYGISSKIEASAASDETWTLELEDIEKSTSTLLRKVRFSDRPFKSTKSAFRSGDVLYGKLRPYLDKVIVADEDGVCTTEIIPIRGHWGIDPRYLRVFLKSPRFIDFASNSTHGMNLPRLGTNVAREAPLPVPPLAEQKRIVAKVDELMALVDALEAGTREAMQAHETLVRELLATLVNSQDANELAENWARIETHFDTLFTTEESVEELRQTVLDLAVRGALCPSENTAPFDYPVRETLSEARAALKADTSDRRIPLAPSTPENDLEFTTPKHWQLLSFEELFLFIDYRGRTPKKTEDGTPLITAKNVRPGFLNPEPREFIDVNDYAEWMTRGLPQIGDLFFTTEAPLGNICLNDREQPFALAQRVICLQPYIKLNTAFFMYAIMSRSFQRRIDDDATGMTARGIKASRLKKIGIPFPPPAEQEAIVKIIRNLHQSCDRLSLQIRHKHLQSHRLSTTLVAAVMSPV